MNNNFKIKNWIDYHKMIDKECLSSEISPMVIENTYVYKLQHQLEEKDKVIDEAIKYMDMVAEIGSYSNSKSLYGEDFDELYEILERGKNDN